MTENKSSVRSGPNNLPRGVSLIYDDRGDLEGFALDPDSSFVGSAPEGDADDIWYMIRRWREDVAIEARSLIRMEIGHCGRVPGPESAAYAAGLERAKALVWEALSRISPRKREE